ncbi:PstS family phosphate ABC transporter substrate-binding protein [Alkalihalobacterium chitinilyticum]|uniref:Phosphate-binding protein n=1 Tax=Alkalihalobacterium chitinilyticum TaxID=2980103 RepID=A0ABT5VCL3_9BACI|nr:PstS family phosphate ABC transporter substrate-binding protein [Alkalihalobacterium chitinilyticum]MDE5412467.1 PstS family phosphate ABC transporter substrate-binding protein [Alkalihalobacterium chitinilyticum]
MKFRGRVLSVVLGASIMALAACGGGNSSEPTANDGGTTGGDNSNETPTEEVEEVEEAELPSGTLQIRGSDTMVNLGQALAEYYMDNVNEGAGLAVTGGGSGTGITALINNDVDIAQSSRAIKEEEIELAAENGVDVHEFVVGQDGVAVAVNPENPITEMTIGQLKDIFTGVVTDWSELGWEDGGEISVYSRQSNSGTYVFFNEVVMDTEDFGAGAKFMPGTSAIKEAIEQEVNAIGYIGVGYVDDNVTALEVALDENSEYFSPLDKANVASGDYPVARPLFFYTNGSPEGLVLHYLTWVLQDADATAQVEATGFFEIGAYQEDNKKVYSDLGIDW